MKTNPQKPVVRRPARQIRSTIAKLLAAIDRAIVATEEAKQARDTLLRLAARRGVPHE